MSEILSGQKIVAAAGTELHLVAAAGVYKNCCVAIKANAANTGIMFIGNDGSDVVSSTTGFQLSAKEQAIIVQVGDLYDIMVDASVSGEIVSWLILGRF